ncbi:hypothetical protein FA13DRAFT_1776412 [Coprinellus micaceus]|uniref:YHYH domain-containing protein n=1 Tax=Coprinellus micaceus TaxID=71717 RepID=A0A4Y7T1S8_COPMI|nr:hypothetical protein FA13DRAFT_1776412 [Coprinellus micaceus]
MSTVFKPLATLLALAVSITISSAGAWERGLNGSAIQLVLVNSCPVPVSAYIGNQLAVINKNPFEWETPSTMYLGYHSKYTMKARHESLAAALENMGSPPPLWRRMATGISGMSAVAIRTFRLEALQRGAESQCFRGTPAARAPVLQHPEQSRRPLEVVSGNLGEWVTSRDLALRRASRRRLNFSGDVLGYHPPHPIPSLALWDGVKPYETGYKHPIILGIAPDGIGSPPLGVFYDGDAPYRTEPHGDLFHRGRIETAFCVSGAGTVEAVFFSNGYYYMVDDGHRQEIIGLKIVPNHSPRDGNCAQIKCTSTDCTAAFKTSPTAFPSVGESSAAPSPPYYRCPEPNTTYYITFCPEAASITCVEPKEEGSHGITVTDGAPMGDQGTCRHQTVLNALRANHSTEAKST